MGGHERSRTPIGGVNMQPETVTLTEVCDLCDWVDARRRGRSHRCHDRYRLDAGSEIVVDSLFQQVGAQAKRVVSVDVTGPAPTNSQGDGRLVDRAVGLS